MTYSLTLDRAGAATSIVSLVRDDGSIAFFEPGGDTPEARAYAAWLAAGNVPSPAHEIASDAPLIVSPLQMRRALRQIGLMDPVQQWVASAGPDAQDAWEYAITFDRSNSLIASAAAALGKTTAQIDELFRLAAQL